MVDVAKVRMFEQNIGTFVWDDSYRVARFEYDNDFVGKGVADALGLSLEDALFSEDPAHPDWDNR